MINTKFTISDFAIYIIFLFWILLSINTHFVGSGSKALYVIIFLVIACFAIDIIFNNVKIHIICKSNIYQYYYQKTIIALFLWILLYIGLSYIGFSKWFKIDNLNFSVKYIPRHVYFMSTLPIAYYICKMAQNFDKYFKSKTLLCWIVSLCLFFSMLIFDNKISIRAMLIGVTSLLYIKKKSGITLLLTLLAVITTYLGQFAALLAGLAFFIILLLPAIIAKFLKKKYIRLYITAIILSLVIVSIYFDFFYKLAFKDVNAIWRLQYWINDLKVLVKTYGIGVGYGTAYATQDLFDNIYNKNALMGIYSIDTALFYVANHSSLINMYYRLGIVGGLLFITYHVRLIQWFRYVYVNTLNTNYKKTILWAFANFIYHFIIILLNPGIESPQFYWGYLCYVSMLTGFLCVSNKFNVNKAVS